MNTFQLQNVSYICLNSYTIKQTELLCASEQAFVGTDIQCVTLRYASQRVPAPSATKALTDVPGLSSAVYKVPDGGTLHCLHLYLFTIPL